MIRDLLAVVLARAVAGLDGELPLALGAGRHIAFKRDRLAHGLECIAGGNHFAAVRGLVTQADDGSTLFVFHEGLSLVDGWLVESLRPIAMHSARDQLRHANL